MKPATKPGVLAKINGREITEEELVGDAKMDFFEIKKREYDLRKERLNKLMMDELIGAEANQIRTTYVGGWLRMVNHYDLALAYLF